MDALLNRVRRRVASTRGLIFFITGFLFALLWSSAATATKIGLQVAQPFVLSTARFLLAGLLMLGIAHGLMGKRLPKGKEWRQLAIYGFLNIALYLGLYVNAIREVSPGLGSLAVAANPVLISLMSSVLLRQRVKAATIISLLLCATGVTLAAWPLLQNSFATPRGILLLLCAMLAYSGGVLYFARQSWHSLHILVLNGWQTLLGGLFLLPAMILTYDPSQNIFNETFAAAVIWLAIPVSIVAVVLWLSLLKEDAVKASFWLFLCPVSGFLIAHALVHEPIGWFTIAGMILVIAGLYLVQRKQ